MEKEFWKNIPKYDGAYQASTMGRVRRHPRMVVNNGTFCLKKGSVIRMRNASRGYLRVRLYDNGVRHEELVHRLVAETFLPNKRHLPYVEHKDGDKTNNRLENLRWSKQSDNQKNGGDKAGRPCKAIVRMDGDISYLYRSLKEASKRTGIPSSNISQALHGYRKTAGGYKWRFQE